MADTTTIGTQGFFGTVTDRIASIATQGHWLEVEAVAVVRIVIRHLAEKHSIAALGGKYIFRWLADKHTIGKLDNE